MSALVLTQDWPEIFHKVVKIRQDSLAILCTNFKAIKNFVV